MLVARLQCTRDHYAGTSTDFRPLTSDRRGKNEQLLLTEHLHILSLSVQTARMGRGVFFQTS